MEKKGLKFVGISLVALLSLSTVLLFSILPVIIDTPSTVFQGIPGLEVSLAQERVYSSPDSIALVECFLDTSNMNLEHSMGVKFTTNSTIGGFATSHYSNTIGYSYVKYVNVTLYPTSANLGETIEVTITLSCSIYYNIITAYIIVI